MMISIVGSIGSVERGFRVGDHISLASSNVCSLVMDFVNSCRVSKCHRGKTLLSSHAFENPKLAAVVQVPELNLIHFRLRSPPGHSSR